MITPTTDFLRISNKSTKAFEAGLTVALLPEGGSAPGDLISLSENVNFDGQYDYPGGVTNGIYTVYVGGVVAAIGGENLQVMVMRGGIVKAENIDFAKDTW